MDQAFVMGIAQQALTTMVVVAAPMLAISLVVGLLVGVFQAVTQINEMTLTFVPKAAALLLGVIFFGPWMMTTLVGYTTSIFLAMGSMGR